MGFERYENKRRSDAAGKINVLTNKGFYLGAIALKSIAEAQGCEWYELFYDKAKQKTGINFVKEKSNFAYKINLREGGGCFNCKHFFERYEIKNAVNKTVNFDVIGSMIVFEIG